MRWKEFESNFPEAARALDLAYHGFADGSPDDCEFTILDPKYERHRVKAVDPAFNDPWYWSEKTGWVS